MIRWTESLADGQLRKNWWNPMHADHERTGGLLRHYSQSTLTGAAVQCRIGSVEMQSLYDETKKQQKNTVEFQAGVDKVIITVKCTTLAAHRPQGKPIFCCFLMDP